MIARIFQRNKQASSALLDSILLDQDTFYSALLNDLNNCEQEVIIESPFITTRRINQLLPTLRKMKTRNVRIVINTRDPNTNEDDHQRTNTFEGIAKLQQLGAEVFYTGGHHRKLVIIDRAILYEGSLNPLSQNDSCEVMRRIESYELAWEMTGFIGLLSPSNGPGRN